MRYRKILAVIMSAALMFTAVPVYAEKMPSDAVSSDTISSDTVSADTVSADSAISANVSSDSEGHILNLKPFPVEQMPELGQTNGIEAAGYVLPVSYNSPYITSVKNQGMSGWCWNFGTAAAAESNILKNFGTTVNLSEKQISYWGWHKYTDPKGGMKDTADIVDEFENDREALFEKYTDFNGLYYNLAFKGFTQAGGFADTAPFMWSTWYAGSTEGDGDDPSLSQDDCTNPYKVYSEETVSVPVKGDTGNKYRMKNCVEIPVKGNSDLIKKLLMQYGGGAIAIAMDEDKLKDDGEFKTLYNPTATNTNHIVELVGWDDSYSAKNFVNSDQLDQDGAWIIKNSWGNYKNGNGYIYVSYEDPSFSFDNDFVTFMDMTVSGNDDYYDNLYSYAGYSYSVVSYFEAEEPEVSYGNIYTVNNCAEGKSELLKGVASWVKEGGTEYNIKIYKDPASGNPKSGTLIYEGSETVGLPGYHTFVLDKAKFGNGESGILNEGDKFYVVLSENGAAHIPYMSNRAKGEAEAEEHDGAIYYFGHGLGLQSMEGKSFAYSEGEWQDAGADILISAFTDTVESDHESGDLSLSFDEPFASLSVDMAGKNAEGTTIVGDLHSVSLNASANLIVTGVSKNMVLTWSSSNPDVAMVNAQGIVTVYKPGYVTISVTSGSGAKAEANLTFKGSLEDDPYVDIQAAGSSVSYCKAPVAPDIVVTYDGHLMTEGVDYKLISDNNADVGDNKTYTINGIGCYTGKKTGTYSIEKFNLSEAGVNSAENLLRIDPVEYTGTELKPVKKLYIAEGTKLDEGSDYAISYSSNVEPGIATVTMNSTTGNTNIIGSKTMHFVIEKRSISSSGIAINGVSDKEYTGSAVTMPSLSVTDGGKTLAEGTDYTVSYADNTAPGTATVTVTGMGKYYRGKATAHFTVRQALAAQQKADISGKFKAGRIKKYVVSPRGYASITGKGVIKAKKSGTVTVTAYYRDGTTDTYTMELRVPKMTKLYATRAGQIVNANEFLTGNDGLEVSYWGSSNSSIARLNGETGEIKAYRSGTIRIYAYFGEGKNLTRISNVLKITIPKMSRTTARLRVGKSTRLRLRNTKLVPEWKSSDESVAIVVDGKVTALKAGTATISATVENVSYTCTVTAVE